MEKPNLLFHYCKLSTALEFILPEHRLLLSPITKTNDPKENNSLGKSYNFFEKETKPVTDIENEIKKTNDTITEGCKVICFSKDDEVHWGWTLSKMWALYGDNHKGICLTIDKEKFIKNNKIDINWFREIKYKSFRSIRAGHLKDERAVINSDKYKRDTINYLKNDFRMDDKNRDILFFTKDTEWESEQEVRYLCFSDNNENEYLSIKDSLVGITLGVNFHSSYIPAIEKLIDKTTVKIVHTQCLEYGIGEKLDQ
jgi:hypothetical protein